LIARREELRGIGFENGDEREIDPGEQDGVYIFKK
jgi:hypothetical protein